MIKKEDILVPLDWRSSLLDMIYGEIFDKEQYVKYFDFKEDDVVVDLGANIGLFSLFALDRQPNIKKIYMVEPLLQNFDYMVRNVIYNKKEDLHKFIFIKSAVSENGEATIGGDIGASLGEGDEIVKTFSFMDFIDFYGINKIDFLKIDIEGSEKKMFTEEVFNYLNDNNVNRICGELHPIHFSGEKSFSILKRLMDMGYDVKIESINEFDIKNTLMNNSLVNGTEIKSWDYYTQYLFWANKED